MSYPRNTPTIGELIDLPVTEIASLPPETLAELQCELNSAAHQLTAIATRFENALEARYGTRASEERRTAAKDTGTIRFADGDVEVIANLPKRVDWNQAQLSVLVDRIRASGDDPSQYVDIAIKVPERKYGAWPDAIRAAFEPARTVRTGKPTFRLELTSEGTP